MNVTLKFHHFCLQSPTATIDDVISCVYDGLKESYRSNTHFGERSILTPINQVVDHLNDQIMDKIPCDTTIYYSSNVVQDRGTD